MNNLERPSRRDFLKRAGKAALGVGIAGAGIEPWLRSSDTGSNDTDAAKPGSIEETEEHISLPADATEVEHHDIDFDKLNRETAIPVAAGFMAFVGNAAAGGSLGPISIAGMTALEANRLGQLYVKGGEHGKELVNEELHENLVGCALAIGLAGISDLTTSTVKFEAEQLLRVTHELEEKHLADNIKRPVETASLQEWEVYVKQLEDDLADQVTRAVAVTGVIAPFSTTYTSSAVANQMKFGTARLVFECNVARAALDHRQREQEFMLNELEAAQQNDTNDIMRQYTDLMTTLAANIQGGVLAGDPPQFFAVVDQWGEWKRLAKAEAYGGIIDVVATVGLTKLWLKRAGVDRGDTLQRIFSHTTELASQAGGLLPAKHDQKSTIVAPNDVAEALSDVRLGATPTADAAAKNGVKRAMRYRATMTFGGYIGKKAKWFKTLPGINRLSTLIDTFSRTDSKVNAESRANVDLLKTILLGNPTRVSEGVSPELGEDAAQITEQIDQLLLEIRDDDIQEMLEDAGHDIDSNSVSSDPRAVDAVRKRFAETEQLQKDRIRAIEDILMELGVELDELSVMDETAMRRALAERLRDATATNPDKVAELARLFGAMDQARAEPVTGSSASDHHEHPDTFFNHTGNEVRDALLTQLQAVGATAVLAEQGISASFSLRGGAERSDIGKVTAAAGTALVTEAIISSLADNVAAYKYGYKVVCAMVEKVYGESVRKKYNTTVLEAFPDLHDMIFAISLKLAESAGALTKLGNGPNFSQEEVVLMQPTELDTYMASLSADERTKVHIEPDHVGTLRLVRRPLPFTLYKNSFANGANAAVLTISTGMLMHQFNKVESDLRLAA